MSKTASLTSGLVAKKGQAIPALASAPAERVELKVSNSTTDYYKSLTVKLDRDRYETLKSAGIKFDKKSQEIFVEALDLWLRQATPQHA